MVVLLQGEATSGGISIRTQHRHIATVEPLVDRTQSDDGVADGGFVMECLQHPSVPKSGDKKPGEADHGPAAEEMKAAALLLAAQVMQRGGDGERRHKFGGGGRRQSPVGCPQMSSQIAVTSAPRACAFDTFGLPFITLDATHCLCVSGHMFEGKDRS